VSTEMPGTATALRKLCGAAGDQAGWPICCRHERGNAPADALSRAACQVAALVERIGQGDRSQVVAWDEVAAAGPVATYQVLVTQQVRQRLRGAPPMLVGSVAGIIAVLRVDPTEASMIFRLRRLGDGGWAVTFGAAQGLLTYWVVQAEQLVVLLDLTWAG
jgi:hypothetical protein